MTIKTPEQIAEETYLTMPAWPTTAPKRCDFIALMTLAIEADRAQRDGALADALRQIRRQEGDWRGLLDHLIGDGEDYA